MLHLSNILIVGGTGRNVGKTELICNLIQHVSRVVDIYGLKVSAIYPDENMYHGDHSGDMGGYHLFEEYRHDGEKDSSRMLRAGAAQVFYLRCEDQHILPGLKKFLAKIPEGSAVICESNSLGKFITPGLFIMLKSSKGVVKERAKEGLKNADLVIPSDGKSGFTDLHRIQYESNRGWYLKD